MKKTLASAAIFAALTLTGQALPSGPDPRAGNVTLQNNGNVLQILQSSPQAIINWQSFNIGQGEIVRFLQPSQTAAILNRVVGRDPSLILGMLQANGHVFLINPNGILFGPGSVVDTGSFMASTLSMSDSDFLARNYRFQQDPNEALRAIVNQGTVKVTDGGFIALTAPVVHNEGVLIARSGQVALGATRQATLNFDGQGLLEMVVPDGFKGQSGGSKEAVLVTKGQMSDVLSAMVRPISNSELVELPQAEGLLVNSGQITTDGSGGKVVLDSSQATFLTPQSKISANGTTGNAGQIYALSAGRTVVQGTLQARGEGGNNGGFIEVSAPSVGLHKAPDLSASGGGKSGTLLIDPIDIQIVTSSGSLNTTLPTIANGTGGSSDTVSIQAIQDASTTSAVIINATRDITLATPDNITVSNSLSMTAGRDLLLNPSATIRSTNGNITLTAGRDLTTGNVIASGDVRLEGGRNATLGAVNATNIVTNAASGNLSVGAVNATGTYDAFAGNQIVLRDPVVASGRVTLIANDSVTALTNVSGTANSHVKSGSDVVIAAATLFGPPTSGDDSFNFVVDNPTNKSVVLTIRGPVNATVGATARVNSPTNTTTNFVDTVGATVNGTPLVQQNTVFVPPPPTPSPSPSPQPEVDDPEKSLDLEELARRRQEPTLEEQVAFATAQTLTLVAKADDARPDNGVSDSDSRNEGLLGFATTSPLNKPRSKPIVGLRQQRGSARAATSPTTNLIMVQDSPVLYNLQYWQAFLDRIIIWLDVDDR